MSLIHRASRELRYVRVANTLREAIRNGMYQPGERLPRQHDLASEHNVAFSTLKQALDLLELEGYVVRKVGQGTYAAVPEEHQRIALVVDDEKDIRDLLSMILVNSGWKAVVAESGPVALAKLNEQTFDLIFLDLVMPEMDGARTFREIRRIDPEANVIIVTAYPNSAVMVDVLQVGPFGMMKKPFTLDELHRVLGYVPDSAKASRSMRT